MVSAMLVVILVVGSIIAVVIWIALVAGVVAIVLKATLRRVSE
jgi:hypothetical protein